MAVAIAAILIAAGMPLMEVVPFSANLAGVALTTFGLALLFRDGLLALAGFVITGATVALIVYLL